MTEWAQSRCSRDQSLGIATLEPINDRYRKLGKPFFRDASSLFRGLHAIIRNPQQGIGTSLNITSMRLGCANSFIRRLDVFLNVLKNFADPHLLFVGICFDFSYPKSRRANTVY